MTWALPAMSPSSLMLRVHNAAVSSSLLPLLFFVLVRLLLYTFFHLSLLESYPLS